VAKLVIFDLVQALALLYVVITRPFDNIKDNIIEILNEILFF